MRLRSSALGSPHDARARDRRGRGSPRAPVAFAGVAFSAFVLAANACSPSPDQGTIQILTVDDPFTGPPAATRITVQGIAYDDGGLDGAVTTIAQGSATAGTLDLGTYDETVTESILVTATDSAGTQVARGETLPVELGAVAGVTLGVFVQRTGKLSRMPSPLSDGRPSPLVSVLGGRYIFATGGTESSLASQTLLYDLISWAPLASPPSLPFAPASIAIAQLDALAISATGASWYSLTSSSVEDAAAPSGNGAWADVAGGATIVSSDGSTSYVVGGTRTSGPPTSTVLVVTSSGAISWATLATPRLGATAAWVDGLGLVVEGGNVAETTSSGAPAPGAEYLVDNANGFPLDYPPDETTGAGMAVLGPAGSGSSSVLVVGGATTSGGGSSARVLTVPCGTSTTLPCAATTWPAVLPTALTFAQAFTIDPSSAFVVGEDASGAMHAYRLSQAAAVEVGFQHQRSHARAVRLPFGAPGSGPIAVVGGDPTIESFIP